MPHPSPPFDLAATTIPALVERAAERFGEREALVGGEGDRRLTFADLAGAVDRAARPWSRSASRPATGSPCGRPTRRGGPSSRPSARCAGAVLVTVNTRFKGGEAAHVISTAGARCWSP